MEASETHREIARSSQSERTRLWLEEILSEFSRKNFLYSDPLGVVHQYQDPKDQELIALVSALFAFGNVTSILKTLEQILRPLEGRPYEVLLHLKKSEMKKIWGKSYYRFYTSADIIFLFDRLQRILKAHGRLETAFASGWKGDTLTSVLNFRSLFTAEAPQSNGIKFMFAHPFEGTAKRWHMFLRWVVRKDDVDLGLWKSIPKSHLIQPLDTHLFQIGRALKLTRFKSPGLNAALQMTESFKKWAPEDPIKFDFALCRLGVLRQRNSRLKVFLAR